MINQIPCIFCGKPFESREDGGDHIIPSGLGKFNPGLKIKDVCRICDNEHGATFERVGMRDGLIGVFRNVTGIKSEYRKKSPPYNPSNTTDTRIEARYFGIETGDSEPKEIYITDKSEFRTQNEIISYINDEIVSVTGIPFRFGIKDACDFICERLIEFKKLGLRCELRLCTEPENDFIEELARREVIILDSVYKKDESKEGPILIKSILTMNHFRFAASIIAKAMYYSGVRRSDISSILFFIDSGNLDGVLELSAGKPSANFGFIAEKSREGFGHQFFWHYSRKEILLKANFLINSMSNGIDLAMKFETKPDIDSPEFDNGLINAKYKDDARGELEIFHKEDKIS